MYSVRKTLAFAAFVVSTLSCSVLALGISFFDPTGENIHRLARFWGRLHLKICGINVVVRGLENLDNPPYVIMCNHQSALDIYALLGSLPVFFKWIAKRQLFKIPFFGWAITKAGYISIDRENPREALKSIEEASRKIRAGMNILIFPEGTRSPDGVLLPFKKGGFTLALRAMVPIVPIGVYGTSMLQPKGSFIPKSKGTIYINIGSPIILEGMDRAAKTTVMGDVRAHIERLITCQAL